MESDSDIGKTINKEIRFHTFAQKEDDTDYPELKTWGEEEEAPKMVQGENGENRYACSLCDKTFKLIVHLRKHKRTHDRRRPWKCGECGKEFRDKQDLVRHHRMHTGEKPYNCPGCSKSFGRKTHLNRHLRIHTGERPYECEKCGKRFNRKFILDTHYKVHRKEKLQAKLESFETTDDW